MDTVIRHLAVNQVRSNGLLCKRTYDELTDIETSVVYTPNCGSYGMIMEGKSTDNFTTYFLKPIVNLVPCEKCLKEYHS